NLGLPGFRGPCPGGPLGINLGGSETWLSTEGPSGRCAGMSSPRPVFAGDVIHIQRRVRDGRFFLVPRAEILDLVTYAYGLSAEKFGLELHAVCVMSNHLHVVATDVEGRHPEFTAWAHRVMALALKAMHG